MDLLHKKSVLVLMLCVLYSFFISACSGGGGTAKSNVSFSNVSIDQMTLVPSINGTSTSGLMYVHNSGSNSVKILNLGLANLVSHAVNLNQSTPRINANAIGVISDDHGLTLETSDCTTIPAHGYCTFRFHTPSNLSLGGSGITKVTLNYLNAGIAGSTSGIIHYQYMSTSKKFGVNFTGNLQVTAGAEPQYVIGYLWSSSSVANQVFRKVKLTLSDPSLSINNGFTQLQDIAVGEVIPVEFKVNAATSITGNISVKSTPPSNSSTVQVQPSWNNPNYPVSGDAMAITATSSTSIQLYNYLGTGSDPNLLITLENSGVSGWTNGYSISYGSSGGIPYNGSSTSSANWSVWNVYDSSANYYGTITLTTNGSTISYSSYSSTGTNGNYLDGIYIVNGNNLKAESVVCASCHSSSGVANLINSIGNGSIICLILSILV